MDLFDFAVLKNGVESTIRPDWNRIKNRPFYEEDPYIKFGDNFEAWKSSVEDYTSLNSEKLQTSILWNGKIHEYITPIIAGYRYSLDLHYVVPISVDHYGQDFTDYLGAWISPTGSSYSGVTIKYKGTVYTSSQFTTHVYDSGYSLQYKINNTVIVSVGSWGSVTWADDIEDGDGFLCKYPVICVKRDRSQMIVPQNKNFSFVKPNTERIHYLDPKYIQDMYYTEEGKVSEVGATYNDWLGLVGDAGEDLNGKTLSMKLDGVVYKNITPVYNQTTSTETKPWTYTIDGVATVTVNTGSGYRGVFISTEQGESFRGGENDRFSFVKIEDVVHKIPEKYYDNDKYEPVIFDIFKDDEGNYTTNVTWDAVTEAIERGISPTDFVVAGEFFIPCTVFFTNSSNGEITNYVFIFIGSIPQCLVIQGENIVTAQTTVAIQVTISKNNSKVAFVSMDSSSPYFTSINITENSDGTLSSSPSNAYSLFVAFSNELEDNFYCSLYYNGVKYTFEEMDTEAIYFSTVADGIYRRIKITQGTDGAADTVTIDKELSIENSQSGVGLDVTGASVGQIVKISAVDSNGVPTAWEPVDMPSGGAARKTPALLYTQTLETAGAVSVDWDDSYDGYDCYTFRFAFPKADAGSPIDKLWQFARYANSTVWSNFISPTYGRIAQIDLYPYRDIAFMDISAADTSAETPAIDATPRTGWSIGRRTIPSRGDNVLFKTTTELPAGAIIEIYGR